MSYHYNSTFMPLRAFPENSFPDRYMYIKIIDDIIKVFNDDTDSTDIFGDLGKRKRKSIVEKKESVIADENDLLTVIIVWMLFKSIEDIFAKQDIDKITIEDGELLSILDTVSRQVMFKL